MFGSFCSRNPMYGRLRVGSSNTFACVSNSSWVYTSYTGFARPYVHAKRTNVHCWLACCKERTPSWQCSNVRWWNYGIRLTSSPAGSNINPRMLLCWVCELRVDGLLLVYVMKYIMAPVWANVTVHQDGWLSITLDWSKLKRHTYPHFSYKSYTLTCRGLVYLSGRIRFSTDIAWQFVVVKYKVEQITWYICIHLDIDRPIQSEWQTLSYANLHSTIWLYIHNVFAYYHVEVMYWMTRPTICPCWNTLKC